MSEQDKTIILGGGIAGLSIASFLDTNSVILEKQKRVGGLCQSYSIEGVAYDLGPHIIFSKNQEVLNLHTSIIATNKIRRSNQIYYQGRYIKYPFENDLSSLPEADRDYCLKEFLNNPYENYKADNMLQFFLKTFGEGITRRYLQPYNEKIWKFDPSFMDTQMVERIPKPPKEDVIASASGKATEGYTHQLYFHYPENGGFQSLIDEYARRARKKSEIHTDCQIISIQGNSDQWCVNTNKGPVIGNRLINCMPLHQLFRYFEAPNLVKYALAKLKYNSIHIIALSLKNDAIGNHFALYFADPSIIFHRLSKLNFLGPAYCKNGSESTLILEVTFRPDSYLASLSRMEITSRVISDLSRLGLIIESDVISSDIKTEEYAYVIYDLDHRKNADTVLNFLEERKIWSAGRFAQFEYLNSDGVVEQTLKLARKLNTEFGIG